LTDSWELLQEIVGEPTVQKGGHVDPSRAIEEGRYLKGEFEDSRAQFLGGRYSFLACLNALGSVRFLTEQYRRVILNDLRQKAAVAQVGGDHSLQSRIKGYLNTLYPTGFPNTFEVSFKKGCMLTIEVSRWRSKIRGIVLLLSSR
jgi:hypothetical protein